MISPLAVPKQTISGNKLDIVNANFQALKKEGQWMILWSGDTHDLRVGESQIHYDPEENALWAQIEDTLYTERAAYPPATHTTILAEWRGWANVPSNVHLRIDNVDFSINTANFKARRNKDGVFTIDLTRDVSLAWKETDFK